MEKKELNKHKNINYTSNSSIQSIARFAAIIFNLFIHDDKIKCEFSNCEVNEVKLMVASHMLPKRYIKKFIKNNPQLTNDKKILSLITPANVLLLCGTHDKMIDNFLICFDNNNFSSLTKINDVCKNGHNHKYHKYILCTDAWINNNISKNTNIINYYSRQKFMSSYNYIFDNFVRDKKVHIDYKLLIYINNAVL